LLNHAAGGGGVKVGSRADDLAAVLKALPVASKNGLVGFPESVVASNAIMAGLVGSKDASWGQMPVRQDAAWDGLQTVGKFADPLCGVVSSDVPSDGTEIWRSVLPVSDLPAVGENRDKLNGPALWNEVRRISSVPNDARAQYLLSAVHPSSWDSTTAKMWSAKSSLESVASSLPLPDVLRQLAANKYSGTSSEADFGVWSHTATTVPSQQPPIDNGTAIWGSPPSLGDTPTSSAAARPPTAPALPFSIDLTVPPPPLPKSAVCPPASAWNPSAHVVCIFMSYILILILINLFIKRDNV